MYSWDPPHGSSEVGEFLFRCVSRSLAAQGMGDLARVLDALDSLPSLRALFPRRVAQSSRSSLRTSSSDPREASGWAHKAFSNSEIASNRVRSQQKRTYP